MRVCWDGILPNLIDLSEDPSGRIWRVIINSSSVHHSDDETDHQWSSAPTSQSTDVSHAPTRPRSTHPSALNCSSTHSTCAQHSAGRHASSTASSHHGHVTGAYVRRTASSTPVTRARVDPVANRFCINVLETRGMEDGGKKRLCVGRSPRHGHRVNGEVVRSSSRLSRGRGSTPRPARRRLCLDSHCTHVLSRLAGPPNLGAHQQERDDHVV